MNLEKEKEKKYIKEIFDEIGVWSGDVEEHYYKNGEEISEEEADETSSQKTLYLEEGEYRYEINSNGSETILVEYEDGNEVERFIISEEDLFDILGV